MLLTKTQREARGRTHRTRGIPCQLQRNYWLALSMHGRPIGRLLGAPSRACDVFFWLDDIHGALELACLADSASGAGLRGHEVATARVEDLHIGHRLIRAACQGLATRTMLGAPLVT